MPDPFKLGWKLIGVGFKIAGYVASGMAEAAWHISHGRRDLCGQVIGRTTRGIVDALSELLKDKL